MKRTIITSLLIAMMAAGASAQEIKKLPAPDMTLNVSLVEALQKRKSDRSYNPDKDITDQQLSQILWAACGINRSDRNLLTIPTATNAQDISVYVCTKNGVALYEPKENQLRKVSDKDIRTILAHSQQNMASAPTFLLIVSDKSKFRGSAEHYGAMDAGYSSQNICLMCAALGLKTVPRGIMDTQAVKQALELPDNITLELNHPIGY